MLDQLDGWKLAQVLADFLCVVMAWIAKMFSSRLYFLEKSAVLKDAFNQAISDIKIERRTMHDENKDILARIEGKIDVAAQATLIEQVRALSSDLGKLNVYTGELKHNYIDPYTRAVDVLKTRVDEMDRRMK